MSEASDPISYAGVSPLHWPGGRRPSTADVSRRGLFLIPIVGSVLWHRAYSRLMTPIVDQIASQLRSRPPMWKLWGMPPDRLVYAKQISHIVANEIGWPNDHFIPEDPFEIVFFAPLDDGGAVLEILVKLGKLLGAGMPRIGVEPPG